MDRSEAMGWLRRAEADRDAIRRERRAGLATRADLDKATAEVRAARAEVAKPTLHEVMEKIRTGDK